MRLEYVVISLILVMIVLLIMVGLLSGIVPGYSDFLKRLGELIGLK